MPSVSVKVILSSRKEILKWQIHPVIDNPSLYDFFRSLATGQISSEVFINKDYHDFLLKAKVGNLIKGEFVDVNIQCKLNELLQTFGNFILFELQIPEDYQSPFIERENDAFKVLVSNSTQLALPSFKLPKKPNKKDLLRQDLVAWIKNNGGGWKGKPAAESTGKYFINDLWNSIWYVDTCGIEKMKGRSIYPPKEFEEFFNRSDPSSYKNARPKFDYDCLNRHANSLFGHLNMPWMDNSQFTSIYPIIERFSKCLNEYSIYLKEHDIKMSENHNLSIPVRSIDDSISVKVYDGIRFNSNSHNKQKYESLNNKLSTLPCWEVMDIEPFVPSEPSKKYVFIHNLPENICQKFGIFRYSSGNNAFHACFLWRVDEILNNEEIMNKSYTICNRLKSEMPTYHTRFMRKQFQYKADLILGMPTKHHQARALYQELTGDSSSATNMTEKQIMSRVKQLLTNGDDKVIVDLRNLNKGRPERYSEFWKYVEKYLEEHAAVDDRRHGTVVHLSHAISVRDLIAQVTKICPSDTPIPSKQWLRMQFSPNNETVKVSEYYTGRLNIKYMVQARQLRVDHPDFHYASALFRYEREMAVKYREYSNLIFMDDKHRCKVGEPGYPVAAVERGKSVIVANGATFAVADHDFTKCGLTPSVIMHAKIPKSIDESFYRGKVYVGLKDPIFEPSNAARHATELYEILDKTNKPYLFLYTDGGPDHQVKFIKTQLALISLFLALDLDYLVAVRTPPGHSWKNPVERIMSILNLGLQCVGLMRQEMDVELEGIMSKCNSMNDIRKAAEKSPSLKEGLKQSLNPMITLLNDVFERLQLKDENFKTFEAASELDMDVLWNSILQLDPTLTKDDRGWANIKNKPISKFFDHCCRSRSYFFSIKKCGKDDCEICLPIRSPQDIFNTLDHLPDPVPANNEHYKNFSDVYHMDTSESYCPSIQARKEKLDKHKKKQRRDRQMPWTGNAQRAKNVGMTVTCMGCNKPRCLYASKKITEDEKKILMAHLDTVCYTCGATFSQNDIGFKMDLESDPLEESSRKRHREELDCDNILSDMESAEEEEEETEIDESIQAEDIDVCTKRNDMNQELKNILSKVFVNASLECYDEMEKAYYSANFLPVCFNCGSAEYITPVPEKQYPYCEACTTDPNVSIKTGKGLKFSDNTQSQRLQSKRKGKKVRKY